MVRFEMVFTCGLSQANRRLDSLSREDDPDSTLALSSWSSSGREGRLRFGAIFFWLTRERVGEETFGTSDNINGLVCSRGYYFVLSEQLRTTEFD